MLLKEFFKSSKNEFTLNRSHAWSTEIPNATVSTAATIKPEIKPNLELIIFFYFLCDYPT